MGDELYEKLLKQSYYLQTSEELIIHKCGICYDYVELERSWFLNHDYNVQTYFTTYHNHTILIYQDSEKYYFFERSFKELNGIYEFDCLDDALNFYLQRQIICSKDKIDNIKVYPYDNVIFGCGFREFIENIVTNNKGKVLKLKFDKEKCCVKI